MDMGYNVIPRRLRSCGNFPSGTLISSDIRSARSFSFHLESQSRETQHATFKFLIEEEASLVLEYNALRALLKETLRPPIKVDKSTLLNLVKEALDLAQLLTKKYDLYINEHPGFLSRRALQKHQESYKRWIASAGPLYIKKEEKTWLESIQDRFNAEFTTDRMNPRRLYFLRERRLLVLLVPVIKDFGHYRTWILWADSYVAPFLLSLNVVFFLPRLIFNLRTLYENVFDKSKMKPEAIHLDAFARFKAQWMRLWPQIMNDVAWAISGTLMFFVFVGSWQPLGIYLSVAMQFYDVVMASIRAWIDFSRLSNLEEQYSNLALDLALPRDARYKHLHQSYCKHLQTGIKRETALLYLALANTIVLFFAICLALPFVAAINPMLPIVGAVMAIIMTIINFQGRNYLNTPEFRTLDNLLELGQPACPVGKLRANSMGTLNLDRLEPSLEPDQLPQQPLTPQGRVDSAANSLQFFSPNKLARSQSEVDLKTLSSFPSATGINASLSMDDLDSFMVGGTALR